ncbi:aspartate/glutamate racemase family protein [Amycolatopsis rubida]|uniref:Aspartate racemase n=1 Tax=Amycolatopsis rubida TaxID=112413 RepID=A0A1I6BEQ0_9PSEU|nr:amino acid racemase [Amycolatopsis rubida]SFQ79384.1 aspartate racemase [Amycolatopsis rubida]
MIAGILGGMGPAATAEFYAKLIARTVAERDQDHLRVAIWADPTVPDRVAAVLDGSTDPYPALLAGAEKLRDLGASVIAIPCHTAHFFLPRLVADSGVRFADMIAETAEFLAGRTGPVGLLGTRGTIAARLYQRRVPEAEWAVPSETGQRETDAAVAAVKRGDLTAGAAHFERALADVDAPLSVLACTELPLVAGKASGVLDPTDLLADAVIRDCGGKPVDGGPFA